MIGDSEQKDVAPFEVLTWKNGKRERTVTENVRTTTFNISQFDAENVIRKHIRQFYNLPQSVEIKVTMLDPNTGYDAYIIELFEVVK